MDHPLELHHIIICDELLSTGQNLSLTTVLIQLSADLGLDLRDGFLEGLCDGMTLQRLVVEAGVLGGENDEGDDGNFTGTSLQVMVEPGERLYEDITSLVTELITARSEEEQGLVQIEVDVTMEMSVDEIENLNNQMLNLNVSSHFPHLLFVDLVEVLKLVALSLHIQPIGRYQVWLSLDEMLGFLSCDIAKRSRD